MHLFYFYYAQRLASEKVRFDVIIIICYVLYRQRYLHGPSIPNYIKVIL